jgi:hypothetical protein
VGLIVDVCCNQLAVNPVSRIQIRVRYEHVDVELLHYSSVVQYVRGVRGAYQSGCSTNRVGVQFHVYVKLSVGVVKGKVKRPCPVPVRYEFGVGDVAVGRESLHRRS